MKRLFWAIPVLAVLLACQTPIGPQPTATPTAEPTEAPSTPVVQVVELTAAPTESPTFTPSPVPTPTPTPVPTPTPTPTPSPSPTPSPTPVPTPYEIIWLPDTQLLSYEYPEKLAALGEWISDRIDQGRVACVIHTGDVVDNGFKDWEWENFDQALSCFRGRVPFYPVAGNHDIGVKAADYRGYTDHWEFLNDIPEEQKFEGGKMLYAILDAGGEQWLLLGVGWGAGKTAAELAWIDDVMQTYADLPCIFFTHGYLTNQKRILPSCRYLETNIVEKYPNIRLTLSGHSRDYYAMPFSYDDDGDSEAEREVWSLMLNVQGQSYAWRVLTFDPVTHSVTAETFSFLKNISTLYVKDLGDFDYSIENVY